MRKKVNLIAKKEDNLSILDSIIKSRNIENVEEFLNPLNCSLTSPFNFSDMDKAVNIIKNAILDLPEQFRIAIILRELQGLSYEEIAKATHSSIGTVKSRIARARGKLQEDLKAYI